jgi:hypothetical protein
MARKTAKRMKRVIKGGDKCEINYAVKNLVGGEQPITKQYI